MITTKSCVNNVGDTPTPRISGTIARHPKRTAGLLDRLLHHANVVATSGTQSCN
jgi:hypothetical protein